MQFFVVFFYHSPSQTILQFLSVLVFFLGNIANKKNMECGHPYLPKSLSSTVTNGHWQFYCVPEETWWQADRGRYTVCILALWDTRLGSFFFWSRKSFSTAIDTGGIVEKKKKKETVRRTRLSKHLLHRHGMKQPMNQLPRLRYFLWHIGTLVQPVCVDVLTYADEDIVFKLSMDSKCMFR